MSKERNDKTTNTPFSQWLYELNGDFFTVNNIDFVIHNYNSKIKSIMLVEEKRFKSELSFQQLSTFKVLNGFLSTGAYCDYNYRGFHTLVFENTSPKDGKMWWDDFEIDKDKLLEIINFTAVDYYYQQKPSLK